MTANELQDLVLRHRDSESPRLSVDWALLRLLDAAGCGVLSRDLQTHASPWEVCNATERAWQSIPKKSGLYMFVWRPPFKFEVADTQRPGDICQVLYVGKAGAGEATTSNLRERYKSYAKHLKGSPDILWEKGDPLTRAQVLAKYLKLRPLEYWFTVVEDASRIVLLEDRLIQLLNPPMNKIRTPKLVAKPPQPAF